MKKILFAVSMVSLVIMYSCSEPAPNLDVCDCAHLTKTKAIDEDTRNSCEELLEIAKEDNPNFMDDCQ